jgi:SOS-response transcriptional repressor LexA
MIEELDTLSKRLTYALKKTAITQTELARRVNVKKQAIQYLCSSNTNKSKFAYDIAHSLNIDVDWLITGKGELSLIDSKENKFLSEQKVSPILEWNQITNWLDTKIKKESISDWTVNHEKFNEKSFALKLKDNSMFPKFDSNTLIIVDPGKEPHAHCFVLVYVSKLHEVIFRQLIKDKEKLFLHPFNEFGYKQIELSKNDKILGCIVEAKWLGN